MLNIGRLHYITQDGISGFDHAALAEKACLGGAKWVQLRIKGQSAEEVRATALKTLKICDKYGARLIINDFPEIALEIGAAGVHLGKEDQDPQIARKHLGKGFIIGGTANTFEDIQKLAAAEVDYIGLGPFRFTATKKNLSPVLDLEGYQNIMERCEKEKIHIPVIAIGGITITDLPGLFKAGCFGIALASPVNCSENKEEAMRIFVKAVSEEVSNIVNTPVKGQNINL